MKTLVLLLALAPALRAPALEAQTLLEKQLDPELYAHILSTPAIDNHAHPILPQDALAPKDSPDRDFDALPVDNMEPQTDIVAWRADNPQLPLAWKALWGLDLKLPLTPAETRQLTEARNKVKAEKGLAYATWILDQANIATMVANRVSMGPGVSDTGTAITRFHWVPYADALLFPFDNSQLAAETPDKALFFPLEEKLRARYLDALNLKMVPASLDGYLSQVVIPTLERQHKGGAIAEKFEIAYLRSFDITNPSHEEAARAYARSNPSRTPAEYKLLQDYLLRAIAKECGLLGMAVHFHTLSGGGGYFSIAGGNPLLLEPLFNDPALRHTNFVLLHGGWPFVREAGALLQKPNVYLDLSQQALTFPPRTLAGWLREWLETFPDKILFGTDGYALSEAEGWEESTWIAAHNGRQALALALTGMLADGEITRPRAFAIADEVLRNTASQLYSSAP